VGKSAHEKEQPAAVTNNNRERFYRVKNHGREVLIENADYDKIAKNHPC
jgi:hypothetical protein